MLVANLLEFFIKNELSMYRIRHIHYPISPQGNKEAPSKPMTAESSLFQLLLKDVNLRQIEPHIYSVLPDDEQPNFFDRLARFYDLVICNPLYNKLVWGYPVASYAPLVSNALASSDEGWVLDAGCGSLAFSAKVYAQNTTRPVVLFDLSLKLLRIAKARMVKLCGTVPGNMVFLHGDALQLPFKPERFTSIISLNLLHALPDLGKALDGLKTVLAQQGSMTFTTLVKNNRAADGYLKKFEKSGAATARDIGELRETFNELGMPIQYSIKGSLAYIHCGRNA